MPIDKTKDNCSGCTACINICPRSCISMVSDTLGFKYPKVNLEKCINCNLCIKICPFHLNYEISLNFESPISYGGRSKNLEDVEHSQSGAAFVLLSDWILENHGIVYGAGYGEHFQVIHKRAINAEERDEFRGSKYVQSNLGNIYQCVKQDLKNKKIVMFSGTPCQTAGLLAYLGSSYRENLYIMDIVCHGVPGPTVWNDYLYYLEKKEKSEIINVNFRDKSIEGWHSHIESFKFKDGHKVVRKKYTDIFYSNIAMRYSCANCPFSNLHRPSDITVADLWGVERTDAATIAADNKGCSLFLINTLKGLHWFDCIKDKLDFVTIDISECMQPNLQQPSSLHRFRDEYERDYGKYGFLYTEKKYFEKNLIHRILSWGWRVSPSIIRDVYWRMKNRCKR